MRWYSTSKTFAQEQIDLMFDRLELWHENSLVGMTKDKYLDIQAQLDKDPDPARCPPDTEDFPDIVVYALNIFNMLGDRVYPEIGYIGKDYTNLPILLDIYKIENKELFLDILTRLDAHVIKKSQADLKREYDKIKSKSRGK